MNAITSEDMTVFSRVTPAVVGVYFLRTDHFFVAERFPHGSFQSSDYKIVHGKISKGHWGVKDVLI